MRDIVIDETMEDMDKDKDGYVTMDEYLSKGSLLWQPPVQRPEHPSPPQMTCGHSTRGTRQGRSQTG